MIKQILLICADQRQAARVQVALLRYGCMVEIAGTFRRGLSVIEHRPPTAIMIDESLPEFDSRLLTQVLATNPACAGLEVLILPLHGSATSQVVQAVYACASDSANTSFYTGSGHGTARRA